MRWRVVAMLVACQGFLAAGAAANDDSHEAQYRPPPPERRGDFAVGTTMGSGLALATGYPNEADKIGDPTFAQRSGGTLGLGSALWLGGALRDWFVIGFGLAQNGSQTGDSRASTTSFITHLQIYPLYAQGGAFRDLALALDLGAGGGTIERAGVEIANAGVLSTLGTGVVYEPLRWGGFALGPSLSYVHQWSPSFRAHFVSLGLYVAFYASGS
jgi:hypothetical protein